MTRLQKLLSIATEPLSLIPFVETNTQGLSAQHIELLKMRNGFSAFESALVVFPTEKAKGVPDVHEWNRQDSWRCHYQSVISKDYYCFSQDLFGIQFAIAQSGVVRFDPESGSVKYYAKSIEEWAMRLLENYEEDTAWPLAHEWQLLNGVLPPHMRLLPKIPFVLGGEYEVNNLVAIECHQTMEYWARLYKSIRNTPDGCIVNVDGWI